MNADEIRHKILETYEHFKPHLNGYYDYAQRVAALGTEYHAVRLKEVCPEIEQMTLALKLDSRETPKSLDNHLLTLKAEGIIIKKIVFDPANSAYYLFT